jgi:hypothetical protein
VITKLGYVSELSVRPSYAVQKYRSQVIDIRKMLGKSTELAPRYAPSWANLGKSYTYAQLGDKAAGLRVLRHSIENGFFPYPYFANDPLLDALRKEDGFPSLMDAARKRHEAFKSRFF